MGRMTKDGKQEDTWVSTGDICLIYNGDLIDPGRESKAYYNILICIRARMFFCICLEQIFPQSDTMFLCSCEQL